MFVNTLVKLPFDFQVFDYSLDNEIASFQLLQIIVEDYRC